MARASWSRLSALVVVLGLAMSLTPNGARAFCRTSTCTDCPRDPPTGCTIGGKPLAWPEACLSFSVHRVASQKVDLDTATALMSEAFATWEGARCGDDQAPPSIHVSPAFGPAVCGEPQYNPHSGNANLVVFRDDAWPYTSAGRELAATTLTFDNDGVIYDADLEINALGPLSPPMSDTSQAEEIIQFGVIPDQHDLLSIMVHEAGHFLGLDHSREENSVMTAELSAGQVRASLSPDDVAAICEIYPPERETAACDPSPHGGFASACDDTPVDGGCSVQRRGRAGAAELAAFGAALTALQIRRMRRRSDR